MGYSKNKNYLFWIVYVKNDGIFERWNFLFGQLMYGLMGCLGGKFSFFDSLYKN